MTKKSFIIDEEHHFLRIDLFLSRELAGELSRTAIQKLIEAGQVTLNQKTVKANHKVQAGDEVMVDLDALAGPDSSHIHPENIRLDVFYEDKAILVLRKPAGMVVHPAQGCYSGTLVNALLYYCRQTGQTLSDVNTAERPGIVHRLDKETSGLLVVAKSNTYHIRLARQFEKHKVRKKYIAWVQGSVAFDEGQIDAPVGRHPIHREKKAVTYEKGSREAKTYYKVLKRVGKEASLMALFPQSGRTHQLRVHMAHLGHPILGDSKYGDQRRFPRLALHAQGLGFFHPETKAWVEFSSPPPDIFFQEDLLR